MSSSPLVNYLGNRTCVYGLRRQFHGAMLVFSREGKDLGRGHRCYHELNCIIISHNMVSLISIFSII